MLVDFHCQPRFDAERKYIQALTEPQYCGSELRELTISFKLNEKFRFEPLQWTYADKKKALSMKDFEAGFEDFLIKNLPGYRKDLESRHEQNLKRIEEEIENR